MKKLYLFILSFLFSSMALAGPWPCDYSGADTMNCYAHKEATSPKEFLAAVALDLGATVSTKFTLDSNGNITKVNNVTTSFPVIQGAANSALANDGSGGLTWSTAFLLNPMTTTGDMIYSSNNSGSPARLAIGGANTVIHGGATPSYSTVVDADFSGQLTTAKGGTSQNSTATFPTSGVVVTEAGVETLTNKTLTTPTITTPTFKDNAHLTRLLQFDFTSQTNGSTITIDMPPGGNQTYDLPSGSTLVGDTTTQTLTNKSIDGTEINSGLVSRTVGGTGVNSTATFPASGVVVTEAATETLTSKTLSGNIATNLISGAATVTLPTTTGTLATLGNSETFTNKTLTSPTINSGSCVSCVLSSAWNITDSGVIENNADHTKQAGFDLSGETAGKTANLKYVNPLDAIYTFPTATTTVVGTDSTQTLTNKTLNGNTATNLISGSGTLTLNTTGTITVPNATDTIVGKATTDTLTNKILSGNTATNLISGSGTLTLNTTGTITVPNATDTLVGKATTDTLTNKSIAASEINSGTLAIAQIPGPAASGTSGYLSSTDWTTFNTAAAGSRVVVGTAQTSDGTVTNQTVYTNLSNSITAAITPGVTGKYKGTFMCGASESGTDRDFLCLSLAGAGQTGIFNQCASWDNNVANVPKWITTYRVDTLTSGTAYTYTVQGHTAGGSTVEKVHASLAGNGCAIIIEQMF